MKQSVQIVIAPFVLSRLWVAVWVYIGHLQHPYRAPLAGVYAGVNNWWLNPWTTYDSEWFLRMAQHGYEARTATFFPLYPFSLRLAGTNEIAMAAWGVVLSNLAFFCFLFVLHHLTQIDYDAITAKVAVWLLAFSPLSAVFGAVYTDALFGALLVTAFLFARRSNWLLAGIFAALASLTRNAGPIIFLALLLEWRRTRQSPGEGRPAQISVVFTLFPLLAFLGVQLYVAAQVGGLTGVTGHNNFGRALTWPWLPLWNDVWSVVTLEDTRLMTLLGVATTVATFVLAWVYRRRQPLSYSVLMIGVMMMQLTFGRTFAPYTNSSLRFMTALFPLPQLTALVTEPLTRNRFRLLLAAAIYLMLCAIVSMYFGRRQFVMG